MSNEPYLNFKVCLCKDYTDCTFIITRIAKRNNSNYTKDNFLKIMKIRIFSKLRNAFTMTNSKALSGVWENVILTNIMLTTDGSIGCVKSDTRCHIIGI